MADEGLLVTISGAALSLLLYENVRSPGDQMGFLLGETLEFVVKSLTDSDNQVETIKIHNNVQTIVTCPLPDLLHDATGRINKEKLKDFIRDKGKQVIGWFCFRKNTPLVPTMRDKILHKEFASHFSGSNGSKEELFITCLLSSSMTDARGTHKFRHVFLRRRRGLLEPIPLKINNLGADVSRHDGSDYKPTPTKKSSDIPDVFRSLIEPLDLDLARMGELESAIAIQKTAEQYLNQLIPEVCQSDLEVAELERQVRDLRNSISMHNLSKRLKASKTFVENAERTRELDKDNASEDRRISKMISPPRIGPLDNIRMYKDHSTSTSQTITVHKTRSATQTNPQTVLSQEKTRRTCLSVDVQSNLNQDARVNTVSEMKMDMGESVPNRNRRSTGMVSEIVKESICKGEANEFTVGAGRGKLAQEFNPGARKARRSISSIPSRSTDRNTFPQFTDQETTTEARCVRSSSSHQVTYSQALGKNLNNARQNAQEPSENH